jgi:hypothetical protein
MTRFGYTVGANFVLVIMWAYIIATGIAEGNPRDAHLMVATPVQILTYALLAIAYRDEPKPDKEQKPPPVWMAGPPN